MLTILYKSLWALRNQLLGILGIRTIGARALVMTQTHVLLVKHTYQKGWCTIGGGVDKGESPRTALIRELHEEVGVVPLEEPVLFSVYHSRFEKRDDYIVFYIVKKISIDESDSWEIAEKKWFPLEKLPPDITPATLRRVEEVLGKREKSDIW